MITLADIALVLFGAVLGIGSSGAFWWLQTHYWVPKVCFSEEIAEYELPSGERFFQCAFENTGRRDIVDIEILVRIGVFGFMGSETWAYHIVKSNASRVPVLSRGERRRVRVSDTREEVEFIDKPSLTLRSAIESCHCLKDILKLGSDATVRVHVLGFDAFGGNRKHFQSKPYRRQDIRKGTFEGLDVVKNKRFARNLS